MCFGNKYIFLLIIFGLILITKSNLDIIEDNTDDFAEFEDEIDRTKEDIERNKEVTEEINKRKEDIEEIKNTEIEDVEAEVEEAVVEDEDDEFSHFADEEEFIGYTGEKSKPTVSKNSRDGQPKITITKVPLHLRSNWDSYYLEILMMIGIVVYMSNFIMGKGKNQKLATRWFEKNKLLLESSYSLVGDDGKAEIETPGLIKESENVYVLWCSGHTLVEGMLVELRLLKRQDLIGVISQLLRPRSDQLIFNVNVEEMDGYVFALATKKAAAKMSKEMADISTYCPEKKSVEKFGYSSRFVLHSEIGEVSSLILKDPKVSAVIKHDPELLEYFHFSDQYSGPKQPDETAATKLPQVKKMLIFCFNFPREETGQRDSDAMFDAVKPLLFLVLHLTDKLVRFKLTREAKVKSEKNRSRVEEIHLKATHAARAEVAQNLRDEKKKQERERIMSLDDPEKQRKWEEKEQKRTQKKKTPKIKTLKIKPM